MDLFLDKYILKTHPHKAKEKNAESIIDKAKKEADKLKRDSLFETKEEAEWEIEFGRVERTERLRLPTSCRQLFLRLRLHFCR